MSYGLIAFIKDEKLVVEASTKIKQIEVFDIAGKLIENLAINKPTQAIESNFYYAEGIYMLKIKLDNNIMVTKKLINKK